MGDTIEKIARWLKYGVFLSFVPWGCTLLINKIIGYDINIIDTMPDFLLLAFAVAVNALCNETDNEKNLNRWAKIIFQNITRATMFLCTILYYGIFNIKMLSEKLNENFSKQFIERLNSRSQTLLFIGWIIFLLVVINVVFGIIIEAVSNKKAEGEHQ